MAADEGHFASQVVSEEEMAEEEIHSADNEPDTNETGVMAVLRIMAETQRDLARSRSGDGKANKVRVLSNIRIPEFDGGINTSIRKYREWRKRVEIIQHLNDLKKTELAMLLYSQLTGRPKRLVEVIDPEDLQNEDCLNVMYRILDEAYEHMSHERLDDILQEWETAHRRHGQPMQDWCTYLRKLRLELQAQDGDTMISDQALASKM